LIKAKCDLAAVFFGGFGKLSLRAGS